MESGTIWALSIGYLYAAIWGTIILIEADSKLMSNKSKEDIIISFIAGLLSPLLGLLCVLRWFIIKLPILAFKAWAALPDTKNDVK